MNRSASRALPRSTARVYWVRSLVPTLKKALTSASRSAMSTAAGVSIMTPTGTDSRRPDARAAASACALLQHDLPRLSHLLHPRDQRQHQLDVAAGGGAEHGAELGPEHLRLVEADPDRAPAEERIGLRRRLERRGELVAAQVEGADDHRAARGRRAATRRK